MKKLLLLALTLMILAFTGCSALDTAVKKRNLETQTKMSETIWLNPQLIGDKTIFVQIKNTSTSNIDLENHIKNILTEKGYKIVSTPKNANYWLQVNVLNVGKMDLKDSEAALTGLTGAGIGATLGAYNTGSANAAVGWGIVGGIAGVVADAMVSDNYYTMITDILVSEKTPDKVKNAAVNATTQGTRGVNITKSQNTNNMNKYQTRVVSTANQVNLKLNEAEPKLEAELLKVISNIF
ncbi:MULTISPECIES: complement resistance protein TraT [Fusobacterium]|uniref:Complement resistance protein TraT n=1 Tax=Fusobacterium hominis TaxID=2764326 RepID=A0A7G9GWK5_9FUSO|nr:MULTISPECIES: complement resistance protein TraT [Fusobacterium]QNM15187.1 complement resistance protein TraT [Fusobacterium hominis]